MKIGFGLVWHLPH